MQQCGTSHCVNACCPCSACSYVVEPVPDVPCPTNLLPIAELELKVATLQPHWVALDGQELQPGQALPVVDEFSGVVQRRLSNGMRINYRHTDNESRGMLIRLIAPGQCPPGGDFFCQHLWHMSCIYA